MSYHVRSLCLLVLALAALGGCSNQQATKESKKAAAVPDRIQGKAQVLAESGGATDAALNAGGPSLYLADSEHRYRLFVRTAVELVQGNEYVAEGVYAQKAIDDIGDPDQGKNGYPLPASCERAVRTAWAGLAFDAVDANASVLRATVKRYPARPIFLVTRLRPATAGEASTAEAVPQKEVPEVSIMADKQSSFLMEGPIVQPAPLWEPAGGTVHCKVLINPEGKIASVESYAQLCENVPWTKFRYQPPVQAGHPVKVRTEVEVRYEARK
ncbi:MAG: hypothetical protein WDO73_14550 [Ignavibacteriota bacterium]